MNTQLTPCISCEESPKPCVKAPQPCSGEKCAEIYPAQCTEYQDEEFLANIGVKKGDRLNEILKKWNTNQQTSTQAISTEDTNSIEIEGSGVGGAPVKASLKVDPIESNLIQVSAAGVKVVIDKATITGILTVIKSDEDLSTLFCEIVATCQLCDDPDSLTATIN